MNACLVRWPNVCRAALASAVALLALGGCAGPQAAQQTPPTSAQAKPAAAPTAAAKPAATAPASAAKPAATAPASAAKPATGAQQSASSGQTYRYRLALVLNRTALSGELVTALSERAKEKSNGRIVIDVFDNAQLGGETEAVASLRSGTIDFSVNGVGLLGTVEPSLSLTELPYLWKSPEALHRVVDGPIGQRMLSALESKGIKGLVFGEWGPRSVLAKTQAINTPDDLKGLKLRVVESPIYVATWRALGASPTPMAWPEVYTGLQQGTIDAVDAQPFGHRDAKQYEVAKQLSITNHTYTAILLVMNLDKWKTLPPDLQQILME
ncbi:MAG: TRAP transporter substrate-binding protein, partial [Chloroflexi bacterium]|nr:TRAP transporter substrate-binding protein [Chloroflexota bacterium]